MCKQCVAAVRKHWPDLSAVERHDLLWDCTSYPFGEPDVIERRVAELARLSRRNFSLAWLISEWEMDCAMDAT